MEFIILSVSIQINKCKQKPCNSYVSLHCSDNHKSSFVDGSQNSRSFGPLVSIWSTVQDKFLTVSRFTLYLNGLVYVKCNLKWFSSQNLVSNSWPQKVHRQNSFNWDTIYVVACFMLMIKICLKTFVCDFSLFFLFSSTQIKRNFQDLIINFYKNNTIRLKLKCLRKWLINQLNGARVWLRRL